MELYEHNNSTLRSIITCMHHDACISIIIIPRLRMNKIQNEKMKNNLSKI